MAQRVAAVAIILAAAASAQAQRPAMKVLVAPVLQAPLAETLPLSGSLTSPKFSNLTTRLSGSVETVFVDMGTRVQAGDQLLSLDEKLARLELERLDGALKQAEILHRDALRRVDEARRLTDNNNISKTEFDARIAQADADLANVSQLRAQQAAQQEQLDRHILRAPFPGVIAEKLTEEGEWVREDTPVLVLAQMDPLFLDVRVPERYAGRLRAGGNIHFSPGARPGAERSAEIDRVVPVSNPSTRTFLVRAVIANSDWSLQPGMSVKAELELAQPESPDVLQVPADAVVRKPDGSSLVWVVRDSGYGDTAQPVSLRVGRSAGQTLEIITNELAPGDRVVVLGNESLSPGQALSVELR